MTFKRISVAGKIFGHNSTEEFADNRLLEEYRYAPSTKNGKDIKELLTMMAVCHTVVPELKDGELSYQSSSPDEGALVRGAASQGFVFHSRYPDKMVLSVLGKDEELEVLDTIDFTSDRRRMSVIVRDSEGCIKLYTKGADTVILDRLAAGSDAVVDLCQEHLQNFASCGYRTLCFATRTLEKDMYTEWSKGYRDAALLITGRQQAIAKEADKIEVNLRLVGCTAIEDKLQEVNFHFH
ncbi:unnamed protein product [Nippostrongylus brasiliensis]|uniref:Phospholipid-transporting ATPase tat-1 (inferred by orthology to a C. elegans protein) n=1 Tax=Nippostrongylus brasiliensis TaxID=27835 RepID=A0A0N4XJZ4_NIPBR|nr:unnamed protein product [Nippostrongylus brasiliensis]